METEYENYSMKLHLISMIMLLRSDAYIHALVVVDIALLSFYVYDFLIVGMMFLFVLFKRLS